MSFEEKVDLPEVAPTGESKVSTEPLQSESSYAFLTFINQALDKLRVVYKLRKDNEILSSIKAANLGLVSELDRLNHVVNDENGDFMDDLLDDFTKTDLDLETETHSSPLYTQDSKNTFISNTMSVSPGSIAANLKQEQKEKKAKKDKEIVHNKSIMQSLTTAGQLSSKEREKYNDMLLERNLLMNKLTRREELLMSMRKRVQLDNTLGSQSHIKSNAEQLGRFRGAIQEQEKIQILEQQDEIDQLREEIGKLNETVDYLTQRVEIEKSRIKEAQMISAK
jgi:hypothetical protein